jgi:hypothetical protein
MQGSKAPASIGAAVGDEGEPDTMNLADLIASLPEGEKAGLLEMAQQYQDALIREQCQTNFLEFVKAMWPGFISWVDTTLSWQRSLKRSPRGS